MQHSPPATRPNAPCPARDFTRAMLASLVCGLTLLLALPSHAAARTILELGLEQNGGTTIPAERERILATSQALGATSIRYILRYDHVARCDPGANAASPDAACYDFTTPDAVVDEAARRGLRVLVSVYGVPEWSSGELGQTWTGGTRAQFQRFKAGYVDFVQAAVTRYDGAHGHARVDRWTIWNEPNGQFWNPLRDDAGEPVGPLRYAELYDEAARRIKAHDARMLVAVGPTAPIAPPFPPMEWARIAVPELHRRGAPIDAWAHNGYMATQAAFSTTIDDPYVGLGNVDDLTALLDGTATTKGLPVWITEFGYQTPPSPQPAVPPADQARLLGEAVYFAWLHPRVASLVWYSLVDDDRTQNPLGFQSGLYSAGPGCANYACPKPAAGVFRHPLWVSKPVRGRVLVWGFSTTRRAKAFVRVWRRGGGWTDYRNADTAKTGAVQVSVPLAGAVSAAVCDPTCGRPAKLVRAARGSNPARAMRLRRSGVIRSISLPRTTAARRTLAARGWTVTIDDCARCTGTGVVTAATRGVVARGRAVRLANGSVRVSFRLTSAGQRAVRSKARFALVERVTLRAPGAARTTSLRTIRVR